MDLTITSTQSAAVAPIQPPAAPTATGRDGGDHVIAPNPVSTDLTILEDADSGRFVQTFSDLQSDKIVRQYPNETMLAFARAIAAYVKALRGKV